MTSATDHAILSLTHSLRVIPMLDQTTQAKLKKSLIKHEGYKQRAYIDTVGKITAGCGRNLSDRDISKTIIDGWLQEDISDNYNALNEFDWFRKLNDDRKIVILDMSFMGVKKLLGFTNMIDAIIKGDYNTAALEM